jgi:hypothetical protein
MKIFLLTYTLLSFCFISNGQTTEFEFVNCDSITKSEEFKMNLDHVSQFFWIRENTDQKWYSSDVIKIRIASEKDFDNSSEIWSFKSKKDNIDSGELWICESIKFKDSGEYGQNLDSCEFIEYQTIKNKIVLNYNSKNLKLEMIKDSKFCLTLKKK